jgi:hypothetical protein
MNSLVPVTAPASDALARELRYTAADLGVTRARQYRDNRRRLAVLKRKYAQHDRRREPRWQTVWCALWLGWTVAREVLRND